MGTMDYEHSKNETKDWTIMVYLAGGSNVSEAARDSLLRIKEVGSTERFNVIAQFDTGSEGTATKRYHLKKLKGALQVDKVVSTIDTNSLGDRLAKLLNAKPRNTYEQELELLKNLDVTVDSKPRTLGSVLEEVLTTKEAEECFRECLRNHAFRENLVDDPEWLKTYILTCLLEEDTVAILGETQTGDPEVLQKFIQWGNYHYKAIHRMVIIWGHGDGFSVAWDATPVPKTLSPRAQYRQRILSNQKS